MEDFRFLDVGKAIEAVGRYIDNDMPPGERQVFERVLICEPKLNDLYVRLSQQKRILKRLMRDVKD